MRRIIPLLISLCVGVGVGWYFGYSRPTARTQRELLAQYQYVRDNFHMTDAQMADVGPKIPQYFEDAKRQDELAAAVALSAVRSLERGDTNQAERVLLRIMGSYYRVYHDRGGDTNLLAKIEAAAQEHPAVAAEIARKE